VNLAHEYALTRVNFETPADSKFVVRMGIDRHNCIGGDCKAANTKMLSAVTAWAAAVTPTMATTPWLTPKGTQVTEAQVVNWVNADKAKVAAADGPFIKYASLHEMQNGGVSANYLNAARVALSKALNSTARWATAIVNPIEVAGSGGMLYRFDIRDYWAPNKGVTALLFGGSDDDLFFGSNKKTYKGEAVDNTVMNKKYNFAKTVTNDPAHATLIWERVLAGNVEGAVASGTIPPYIDGFKTDYVELGQLVYTLTRPDVYNGIMMNPMYSTELEDELGLVKDQGQKSYKWVVTKQAITVDSRIYFRGKTPSGFFWKTFDIFTGQLAQKTFRRRRPRETTDSPSGRIRFPSSSPARAAASPPLPTALSRHWPNRARTRLIRLCPVKARRTSGEPTLFSTAVGTPARAAFSSRPKRSSTRCRMVCRATGWAADSTNAVSMPSSTSSATIASSAALPTKPSTISWILRRRTTA
jgi:hypothetical protein